MEQEVCRVPPPVVAAGLLPVRGVALPPRLLIPRRQARPHLGVRRAVALVHRAGRPAAEADQEIIGLPTFLMRPDGWAVPRRHLPFKADKKQ